MTVSRQEFNEAMSRKSDEELYDILYGHCQDYTADALAAAEGEFQSRGLDETRLSQARATVERALELESEPLPWPLKVVAFLFSTILFGIPVLLAHRHFMEQGARRKAREWANWALLGLGFYGGSLVLVILLSIVASSVGR